MKIKLFLAIVALLSTNLIFAQLTEVISGLNHPSAIVLNGNDLYISEYGDNIISKIVIKLTTENQVIFFKIINK